MSQFTAWNSPTNQAIADAMRPQSAGVTLIDVVDTADGTTAVQTLIAASGNANFPYNNIVTLTVTNSSATGTWVNILDDDGTTKLWTGYAAASGGGVALYLGNAPIRSQSLKSLKWQAETAVSMIRITVTGYVGT